MWQQMWNIQVLCLGLYYLPTNQRYSLGSAHEMSGRFTSLLLQEGFWEKCNYNRSLSQMWIPWHLNHFTSIWAYILPPWGKLYLKSTLWFINKSNIGDYSVPSTGKKPVTQSSECCLWVSLVIIPVLAFYHEIPKARSIERHGIHFGSRIWIL